MNQEKLANCIYYKDGRCKMRAVCMWQSTDRDRCKISGVLEKDCLSAPSKATYLIQNNITHRGADL